MLHFLIIKLSYAQLRAIVILLLGRFLDTGV